MLNLSPSPRKSIVKPHYQKSSVVESRVENTPYQLGIRLLQISASDSQLYELARRTHQAGVKDLHLILEKDGNCHYLQSSNTFSVLLDQYHGDYD